MRNWKTTTFGLIAAGAGFVTLSPDLFHQWPLVIAIAKYVIAGGLAGLGLASKDSTTHSTAGEVVQTSVKEAAKEAVKDINLGR